MSTIVLGLIVFEFLMLFIQVIRVTERPKDGRRLRYLVLLLFLFSYNLCRLLLPHKSLPVSETFQLTVSTLVTSAMVVYFGYYFYKAFNIDRLQIFISNKTLLSMPFLVLFVFPDLNSATRLDLVPLLFSAYIIYNVACLLIKKLKQPKQPDNHEEKLPVIIAAYVALLCWTIIPATSPVGDFKMENLLLVNVGFAALTLVYTRYSIAEVKGKYSQSEQLADPSLNRSKIEANCMKYKLTKKEIEIVNKIVSRQLNKEIAEALSISLHTVNKHISNILKKADVNSKSDLIHKLNL